MAFIEGGPQANIGKDIGAGVGQWLDQLAQMKMQDVYQRQQQAKIAKAYEPILGSKWASVLAQVPEKEHANWLRALPALKALEQGDNIQARYDLQQKGGPQELQQMLGASQAAPQQAQASQSMTAQSQTAQPQQGLTREEAISRAFEPPQMGLEREKMAQKERLEEKKLSATEKREAHKEKVDMDKYYRPTISKMNEEYKGVRETTHKLDRMEQLVKSGKLSGPKMAAGLQALSEGVSLFLPGVGPVHLPGLNFKSLLKPDSEEFEKLSNDFIKNAKAVFGNRVTDQDLKAFMSTVPNMMMTDEGKLRLIRHMRFYNDAIRARHDAMRSILDKNEGYAPRNFEVLIEEAASKKLDQLASEFKFESKPKAQLMPAPDDSLLGKAKGVVDRIWGGLPSL
jgi:hypothetical protein